MTSQSAEWRVRTGVPNLDAMLGGGLPKGSITVIGGAPGTGKTILAQQICFHVANAKRKVVYFGTLSEPTAKTLRYLSELSFFDAEKMDLAVEFIDLGIILRTKGNEECAKLLKAHIKRARPAIVVIDSFKALDDLVSSNEERRRFGYEIAVQLMAWETTTLLLGEYGPSDLAENPLFSIADGLITMSQRESSGEHQRIIQIVKLRGTRHSPDEHTFSISERGIQIYSPRVTLRREPMPAQPRVKTHISRLDDLLGEGIPGGSSVIVGGVSGTGKTVLLLELIYRGALAGEPGILFSFEETEERLRAVAQAFGWDLEAQIRRGMVQIVSVPAPDITLDAQLLMIEERCRALGAKRVGIDSLSVLLHKLNDPRLHREKVFQIGTIIHNAGAIGFLATDIPYGSGKISRFGVEETVVDGIILLTSVEVGLERERYLEVYKLRNAAHLRGKHSMRIGESGIEVFPRYALASPGPEKLPTSADKRLSIGVPRLDSLMGGGLLARSATLVSGAAGIGKTTIGLQFLAAGVAAGEPGLFLALEEGHDQVYATARSLGLECFDTPLASILPVGRELARPHQLFAILADKIRAGGVRRLVIDSIGDILRPSSSPSEELRQMLTSLVARLRELDVTTLLTLEAESLYSTESVSDRELSPVADNVIMMRYRPTPEGLTPYLVVVKTRASEHDFGAYEVCLGRSGVEIGERVALSGFEPAAVPKVVT